MGFIAGAAAVALVSGVVQAWNSEKTRKDNKGRMNEIRRLFEAIVPPEYDLSLNDPPDYILEKLGDAGLDMSKLTPELFKSVGKYAPEAAPYVAEANPTLVERSSLGKEGLQAQIDALRQYKEIAKGNDPAFRAKLDQAMTAAQQNAQQRSEAALQDSQRRGTFGSGQSFASILQGASDSMQMGGQAGRDAAIQSYQNQMNALGQSANLGQSIANQDLSLQETNADIINQFNQRTSKNYQAYLNNRADLQNQAQLTNLQNAQDIANRNTNAINDTNRFNLTNRNNTLQQGYNNRVNERNYQNSIAETQAKWSASEKDRINQLKSTAYNDKLQRANGLAGIGAQQIQMNTQATQDRNNLIAGLSNAAIGGLGTQYANEQENARWDKYLQARRAGVV